MRFSAQQGVLIWGLAWLLSAGPAAAAQPAPSFKTTGSHFFFAYYCTSNSATILLDVRTDSLLLTFKGVTASYNTYSLNLDSDLITYARYEPKPSDTTGQPPQPVAERTIAPSERSDYAAALNQMAKGIGHIRAGNGQCLAPHPELDDVAAYVAGLTSAI